MNGSIRASGLQERWNGSIEVRHLFAEVPHLSLSSPLDQTLVRRKRAYGVKQNLSMLFMHRQGTLPLPHFEPGGPRRTRVRTASSSSASLPAKLSCHQVAPASA